MFNYTYPIFLSQFLTVILFIVEETTDQIKQTKREGRKEVGSHEKESRESSQESGQRSQESGQTEINISTKILKEFSYKERLRNDKHSLFVEYFLFYIKKYIL